jgi:hypothetical protein
MVEQAGLVAERAPPGPAAAREQLQVGAFHEALDALVDLVGLAAVLAARRDDQALDAAAQALGRSPGRQQADLRVRARPIAETGKEGFDGEVRP